MRILNGMWVSLADVRNGRILFQVASDAVTEKEFAELWMLTGNAVVQEISKAKEGSMCEFQIRAVKA